MLNLQRCPRRCSPVWLTLALLCGWPLLVGCKPEAKITHYTAPKSAAIDATAASPAGEPAKSQPQQMLGAIVLTPDVGWFFKVTGEPATVSAQAKPFEAFIKSLKFSEGSDPEPQWTLPAGWNALPSSGLRFATIVMGSATEEPGPTGSDVSEQLELSVTRLGKPAGNDTEYVLSNVNRWRGQLQLPALAGDDLAKESIETEIAGHPAFLVNMTGTSAGGSGMGMAPFANQAAGGRPGPLLPGGSDAPGSAEKTGSAAKTSSGPLKFTTPEGWEAGPTNQFRKASFVVNDAGQSVEISVIDLPMQDWVANVNRWRGQVGLEAQDAAAVAKDTKSIKAGSQQGEYVALVGEKETLLGVMVVEGNTAWFIKLKGDKQLAEREKPHFEQFVNSLELK